MRGRWDGSCATLWATGQGTASKSTSPASARPAWDVPRTAVRPDVAGAAAARCDRARRRARLRAIPVPVPAAGAPDRRTGGAPPRRSPPEIDEHAAVLRRQIAHELLLELADRDRMKDDLVHVVVAADFLEDLDRVDDLADGRP